MTDEELAVIKERAEKATPGPWYSDYASRPYVMAEHTPVADVATDADADFIVHARTDVPALVAEVERLQGEEDHLQDALGETQRLMGESNDALIHKLRDAEAEVARLQGIIDRVRGLATHDGQWPRGLSPQGFPGVVSATAVLAILDGEEQS